MADDQKPQNPDAKTPSATQGDEEKMTLGQWIGNYVGLGYFGNTAVSISVVNAIKKFTPGIYDKMVGHYEKKFVARKEAELLEPVADKLDDEAKAAIKESIREEAHQLAEKTAETRLLVSGGFAMIPFQAAKERFDLDKNRRAKAEEAGVSPEELGDPPKFSLLSEEIRDNIPKWTVGRFVALGAAFSAQNVVDGKFGKHKEAMDTVLAKIIGKLPGVGGNKAIGNDAFAQDAAERTKDGVNPKVLETVRMATSDAYMSAVAIATHDFSNKRWAAAVKDEDSKLGDLLRKVTKVADKGGPQVGA